MRDDGPEGTMARVLSVVGSAPAYSGVPGIQALVDLETEAAKARVRSAVDRLGLLGIETYSVVTEGNPRTAIVDYARVWVPDFVFIASTGNNDIARFFVSSIAKTVLRYVPCSVGILRSYAGEKPAKLGMKILLATDGSKHSEAAVRSVARRPWPMKTQIRVVSVIDPAELIIGPLYGLAERTGRTEELKKERAQDAIRAANGILDSAGLNLTWDVLKGDTKSRIIDDAKAWGAHLVVVGARGRSGIDHVMPGSVSEAVAIHAHCSVEVIYDRARFSESDNRLVGSTNRDVTFMIAEPSLGEPAGSVGASSGVIKDRICSIDLSLPLRVSSGGNGAGRG